MALKFIDGFDHYNTADLPKKYNIVSQYYNGTPAIFSPGRYGGSCIKNYLWYANYLGISLPDQQTWIVGMAIYVSAFNSGAISFITLSDTGNSQICLSMTSTGLLQVTRGTSSGTILGTSTNAIPTNIWFYLEVNSYIHPSAGYVSVQVNGVNWLSLTSKNTQSSTNSSANLILIGCDGNSSFSGSNYALYDDLYICDGTGSTNNTFLGGGVRVETLYPNGAGTNTNWTPFSGANYTCVDSTTFNEGSSYVSSSTINQVDTYTMTSLSSTPSNIFGVQHSFAACKTDAGSRNVSSEIISGVAPPSLGSPTQIFDGYLFVKRILETDPATEMAWLTASVNTIQSGYKLIS